MTGRRVAVKRKNTAAQPKHAAAQHSTRPRSATIFKARHGRNLSRHGQRSGNDPQQECRERAAKPNRPAPCQHSVRTEQALLKPICPDTETGEEIDDVNQRKAGLNLRFGDGHS